MPAGETHRGTWRKLYTEIRGWICRAMPTLRVLHYDIILDMGKVKHRCKNIYNPFGTAHLHHVTL